ncbi:hypothetical protein AMK20_28355 [Streptomyces sp. TSRI0261]|nr:hypothetical protein AMK20_28355 [Streptomyces sp. TSRI0261]
MQRPAGALRRLSRPSALGSGGAEPLLQDPYIWRSTRNRCSHRVVTRHDPVAASRVVAYRDLVGHDINY